uniref:Uncharacterized protein n=1 Tax=Minutocellus polymorphus TaxID=265543 RepID=A0A6U0JYV2_9STRA|mmetsp:Transcript_19929/g.32961  ORF Transcript_19929/g.32961 Transcript_19929/m.32961 type:complete len:293 (+) Transcript_19929:134-1012(+)
MFPGVASRLSVASVELSEFVNGESFVGRELARRVVSASSAKEYGRCDDDDESLILLLLHHSCCVRFFSWIESTYVPSYLLSSYSSVRSLCLESVGTMRSMVESAPLPLVCKNLFFFRQLLCEIFNLFFFVTRFGTVVQRHSNEIDWQSVLGLVSSPRYRRYVLDPRLMDYVGSLSYDGDDVGSQLSHAGSTFLHFLCRHDHAMITRIIVEYHAANVSHGGVIHTQHRYPSHGSPAYHFRRMNDVHVYRDDSDSFAARSSSFMLLRDLFRSGTAFQSGNLVDIDDDYGQPLQP